MFIYFFYKRKKNGNHRSRSLPFQNLNEYVVSSMTTKYNTIILGPYLTLGYTNIKPKNLKSMMQMKLVLEFKFDYTALDQGKSYKKYIWITLLKFKFEIYMFY